MLSLSCIKKINRSAFLGRFQSAKTHQHLLRLLQRLLPARVHTEKFKLLLFQGGTLA